MAGQLSGKGEDQPNIRFVHTDIPTFINDLKQPEGKDIWLIRGVKLNALFLEQQWIEEMIMHVIPVALGEGMPLFEGGIFSNTVHTGGRYKVYQ